MNNKNPSPMEQRLDQLEADLAEHFADVGCEVLHSRGEVILVTPAEHLVSVASKLRDHEDFAFELLIDACGVDYAAYGQSEWTTEEASVSGFGRGVDREVNIDEDLPNRFAVTYQLLSISRNLRMRMRVYALGQPPMVASLISVWNSIDWFEREAFDLFGILFDGHPDLRRILTDYGFIGHPFRKDFPLIGQVEMRYDPKQQRVIYQPVSIDPRTLVPRVVREDNRYRGDNPEEADGSNA